MTTFADREQAIEAHYAAQELVAFRERMHRYTRLGVRLAKALHLHGADARLFALELSRRCAEEPSDEAIYRRMADELTLRGLDLSHTQLRGMALAGKVGGGNAEIAAAAQESWPAYVTDQLFSLFSPDRARSGSIPDRAVGGLS
jgi:hypothetical protein